MPSLKKVGAMSRIGHLNALTVVFGERPQYLCESLRLDRVLKEFRFLDSQTNNPLCRRRTRLRQELERRDQNRALKAMPLSFHGSLGCSIEHCHLE
jgi:hypothetical protein